MKETPRKVAVLLDFDYTITTTNTWKLAKECCRTADKYTEVGKRLLEAYRDLYRDVYFYKESRYYGELTEDALRNFFLNWMKFDLGAISPSCAESAECHRRLEESIDPGAIDFIEYLAENQKAVEFAIVSMGFTPYLEYFVNKIVPKTLKKPVKFQIYAPVIVKYPEKTGRRFLRPDDEFLIEFPEIKNFLYSRLNRGEKEVYVPLKPLIPHEKGEVASMYRQLGYLVIFVGDGESDYHGFLRSDLGIYLRRRFDPWLFAEVCKLKHVYSVYDFEGAKVIVEEVLRGEGFEPSQALATGP